MAGISALGTKLYMFDVGSEATESDLIPNLVSIGDIGGEIDEIDTTTLDTSGYKEFAPSLRDCGSVDFEANIDKVTYVDRLQTQFDKLSTDSDIYKMFGISFPVGTSTENMDKQFKGFIKSLKLTGISTDGLLKVNFTVRITGALSPFEAPDKAGNGEGNGGGNGEGDGIEE
jgi:hypothetical protein